MNTRFSLPAIAVLAGYVALAVFTAYWFLGVTGHPVGSDLTIYRDAYHEARADGNPYQPHIIGVSFVNHPFLLTIMSVASSTAIWLTISALAWTAVIVELLHLPGCRPDSTSAAGPVPLSRPVLVLILLAFAPAWETLLTGQVNHFATLGLVTTLAFDLSGRDWAAGLCLALAIVLKTSPAVFLAFYLVTGRWRVVAGAGAGVIVMSAVAIIQFGGDIFGHWLVVLPEIGGTIHPSEYNQSLIALAYRQLEPLGWSGLTPMLLTVHKLAFFGVVALVSYRGWRCRVCAPAERIWLFETLLVVIAVFSPLVWLHHSVFVAPAIVLLLSSAAPRKRLFALAVLVLIQFDRLFEFAVTWHAWPVLLAHWMLLVTMLKGLPRAVPGNPRESNLPNWASGSP